MVMVHDLSPFLLRISGDVGIRWYGLSYITGFVLAYFLIRWLANRQRVGLTAEKVGDFVTYGAIGVMVGGRLGYCVFYSPDLFLKFKSTFPFWGVLALNEGGMASHGGMIGLAVACMYFAHKNGLSLLYLLDLASISGALGIFFGRLANFINGELVGRPVEGTFPFTVKFPQDILYWPNTDVSKLGELAVVADKVPGLARDQWLQWVDQFRYEASAREAIQNGVYQIVDAIQSGNQAAKEAIAPLLTERYPSQLIAALGEGLFVFIILFLFWYKPRRPGVVGCLFAASYAVARICSEQFRMPDAHIGFQWLGLTRGQWLSVAMLIIALVFMFLWNRRNILPTPGWGLGPHVKIHRRN